MQLKIKFQQRKNIVKYALNLAFFTAALALLQLGFSLGPVNTGKTLSFCLSSSAMAAPADAKAKARAKSKGEWVDMPEGGRPAFVGVQGGTVPATVLAKDAAKSESEATTTRPGLSSNDFLGAVRGNKESEMAGAEEKGDLVPFGINETGKPSSDVASADKTGNQKKQNRKGLSKDFQKIFEYSYDSEAVLSVDELDELTRI